MKEKHIAGLLTLISIGFVVAILVVIIGNFKTPRTPSIEGRAEIPLLRIESSGSVSAEATDASTASPFDTARRDDRERISYEVRRGEWLIKISARFCNDPISVAAENNINNPNLIYPGQRITLAKVEPCTPESAKSRTSPEMRVARIGDDASRDKSSRPGSEQVARNAREPSAPRQNCANASWRIKEMAEKLLAQAKCIETLWGKVVREAIAEIDPRIDYYDVIAIMVIESSGNPRAVSPKDCKGLMQLHPNTVTAFGVKDVFDPIDNIRGGVRVLSTYIHTHFGGNRVHGMVAYNIGPYNGAWKFKRFRARAEQFGYYRAVNSLRDRIAARVEPNAPIAGS